MYWGSDPKTLRKCSHLKRFLSELLLGKRRTLLHAVREEKQPPTTHARGVRHASANGFKKRPDRSRRRATPLKHFKCRRNSSIAQWAQRLRDNPDSLADIEQEIDQHYRRGGGQLVASLLGDVTEDTRMDDHIQQVRRDATIPLRAPQPRPLQVRLLCGLVLWVTTAYCAPPPTKATDTSEQVVGLYPELAGSQLSAKVAARPCNTRWLGSSP